MNTLQDIQFVVQATVAKGDMLVNKFVFILMNNSLDFVEDLQPHKGVEHQRLQLPVVIFSSIIVEKLVAPKVQS